MTNSTPPTGGVIRPIVRFSTMAMAKCSGWMWNLSISGASTGTRMITAGSVSMKKPQISTKIAMISITTSGLSVAVPIRRGDVLRDLQHGEDPGEQRRHRHDQQRRRGDQHALQQHLHDDAGVELAGDEQAHEQRVGHGHGGGLGGGEDAAHDAADDDHRHQQRRYRLEEAAAAFAPGHGVAADTVAAAAREDRVGRPSATRPAGCPARCRP